MTFGESGGKAAIDAQARAGNIGGFRSGEVRNHGGDLVGTAVALHGDHAFQLRSEWAVGRIHVGVHRTRLDVIDRDAARAEIAGEAAREAGVSSGRYRKAICPPARTPPTSPATSSRSFMAWPCRRRAAQRAPSCVE